MITFVDNGLGKPLEFIGLSTDKKPKDGDYDYKELPNGSTLYCMDTGTLWMYDKAGKGWREQ